MVIICFDLQQILNWIKEQYKLNNIFFFQCLKIYF